MNLEDVLKKKDINKSKNKRKQNELENSLSTFGKAFNTKVEDKTFKMDGDRYKLNNFKKKKKGNRGFLDIDYDDDEKDESSSSDDDNSSSLQSSVNESDEEDVDKMIDIFMQDYFNDERELKNFKKIYSEYMKRLDKLQKNPMVNYLISIHKMCGFELVIFSPPKMDKESLTQMHKGKFVNDYKIIKNFSKQLEREHNKTLVYNMINFANSTLFTGVIDANSIIINETNCLLGSIKELLKETKLSTEKIMEIILSDQTLKSLFMSLVYNNSIPKLSRTHTFKKIENQVIYENVERKTRLIQGIKEKLK